ncbi:transposable element Tcb1 transposase [Trichonephila clavipes]|nr:transposable element Tcb1 transposase [Trichonephila clavipes]
MEYGWSARLVAHQLGTSDCVVRRCWDQWIREMSFTRGMHSTDRLSGRMPHRRVSQDCIQTITTLSWPAGSPDLSPIEHIWDHLGRKVWHLMSLNELEARLQQVWNEMSQDIIQNLYA